MYVAGSCYDLVGRDVAPLMWRGGGGKERGVAQVIQGHLYVKLFLEDKKQGKEVTPGPREVDTSGEQEADDEGEAEEEVRN